MGQFSFCDLLENLVSFRDESFSMAKTTGQPRTSSVCKGGKTTFHMIQRWREQKDLLLKRERKIRKYTIVREGYDVYFYRLTHFVGYLLMCIYIIKP